MGSQLSTKEKANVAAEERAIVNIWTLMLGQRGIKCNKKALCTLLQWCRNHGVDTSVRAAFSVKHWEQAGELIFESASRGDETAKNIMTTWRLVLDTLKLLKAEQHAKTAAEAPRAPPAKTPSDSAAQEGAAGGVDATSSSRVERMGTKLEGKRLASTPPVPATPATPCAPAPPCPAPPVTTNPFSPPLPTDGRSDDELLSTAPPALDRPNHNLGMGIGAGSRAALGAESSGRELPAPGVAGRHIPSCPQPKPERPKEPPPLIDLWDPNRGGPSCPSPAGPQEDVFTVRPISATVSGCDRIRCWHYVKLNFLASGDLEVAERLPAPLSRLFLGGQEPVSGTTGTVSVYDPVRFWQHMKSMALASGDYKVAERISVPKFPLSLGDQEPEENWTEPYIHVTFKILSQLCQLATQHGLGSPVVTRMLRLLAESEMTPFDIKQIAELLCTPIEYMVFESTWKQYAEKQALCNLAVPQQDPCFGAGVPELLGLPPINNPQLQVRLNPLILAQARDLGMQALMKVGNMALAAPAQSFAKIKQGPKEPYVQFIERLKDAMEKQIANDYAKNLLILPLARDNANEDCKKAIDLLPRKNPSLDEMIDACAEVGSVSYEMSLLADSLAAAIRSYQCYGCGLRGHVRANCPRRYSSLGTRQKQRAVPAVGSCYRCGKPGHFAKHCKSKFHANGQPLSGQGNRNKSAKGKCLQARAPSRASVQACATGSQGQQEDQLAWMFLSLAL
ncbi:uncharacterized protein LOC121335705 [Onychostruthus taczanowskii]|uniref:uncharacterized protein LOC121335705 n=1 Tax=Onychostruthus taczanowskii TaxID=356909 RepID=UPI001B8077DC|nr:uncharacterized protein LOC121335705 [Onychostruthus taczanowskii]XP_041260019.1 uncharacterized protein LOC121335705 [Onychostruthus taczanowskii]XP_041260021.1 uncharacterized protein LOC121335705 [Onychostruthus taczanowskii]XP_041260022.1 uncharacterized protein LOC121335705 [Onychostruthus taczanowskii]XP_041260023.1 uncharacterized protein LOC121335705 [Onychostruthus taczanowskii]XP_041260024.1 uncharacterized protein LOC121335705 [Onychostruthus taczanowskii]XP_041260025.1 uncharac